MPRRGVLIALDSVGIDPLGHQRQEEGPIVVVTSDHGHLEQVAFTRGHPKSLVPTWYFGPRSARTASQLRTPQAIHRLFAENG